MAKYQRNIRQEGEALELLSEVKDDLAALAIFDPQYEKAGDMTPALDWPLYFQSDYQISQILKEAERVLKPSGFCLLWVNKGILKSDRLASWLIKTLKLKIVDFLVWNKVNNLGLGNYFRSRGEYAFLLQKLPLNSKKFTNRSFPSVWDEQKLSDNRRKHLHQKPFLLLKSLIETTTQKGDLVIDPCAGSFVVWAACQSTEREFFGCDLTFEELKEFSREREREKKTFE